MKKHKAGISIFLIIITLATVTFGGVFVDLTRILTAKNRVRTATESAARSVLADYSEDLVSDWGLFAIENDNAKENFDKYLKINLNTENNENKANIIDYDIVQTSVECQKPLNDSRVFSDKINEYSKYRAPVSLTLGVIDKFKAIFGKNNAADFDIEGLINGQVNNLKNKFNDIGNIPKDFKNQCKNAKHTKTEESNGTLTNIDTSKIENMKNDINKSLDDSKNKLENYKTSIDDYHKKSEEVNNTTKDTFSGSIETDDGVLDYDNPAVDADTQAKIDKEISEEDNAKNKADASKSKIENEIQNEVNSQLNTIKNKANEYNAAKDDFNTMFNNINNAMKNDGIKKMAKEAIPYGRAGKIDELKKYIEDTKKDLKSKNDDIIYYESSIAELENELPALEKDRNEQKEFLDKLRDEIKEMKKYLNDNGLKTDIYYVEEAIENNPGKFETIKAANDKYHHRNLDDFDVPYEYSFNAADSNYNKAKNDLDYYKKALNNTKKIKENLENEIESDDFKFKEWVVSHSSEIISAYNKKVEAEGLANDYNAEVDKLSNINTQEKAGVSDIPDFAGTACEEAGEEDDSLDISELTDKINSAIDKVTELLKNLNKELPSAASVQAESYEGSKITIFNRLYDYFKNMANVLQHPEDKFYFVDYVMNKCTYITSQTDRNHYFNYAEVEYIIYGQKSQLANISASIAAVAFMRFVINAVNYWLTTPGELIVKTISAVVRGLTQTALDMANMLLDFNPNSSDPDKGLIAICPSLSRYKVLSYSDHLRILLLLKINDDGGEGALRRCIDSTLKNSSSGVGANSLSNYYTQIKAKSEVDVNLFFIPLLMPDFVNFGSIHDGKYRVTSSITYGF